MADNEGASSSKTEEPKYKNNGQDMTPIICTADISRELLDLVLTKGREAEERDEDGYESYVVLRTTSAKKIADIQHYDASVTAILDHKEETFVSPFVGWSIKRVYDFVKSHIRQDESIKQGNGWTNYTFVILDETSMEDQQTVLLCCDSPDLGERGDEIVLKAVRIPIPELGTMLQVTETLVGTLSEHAGGYASVVNQQPPAMYEPTDEVNVFTIAAPALGRKNRRNALLMAEESDFMAKDKKSKLEWAKSLRVEGCSTGGE